MKYCTELYIYIFFSILQNDEMQISGPSEIRNSFPDVSVAFKLHSEAGKLINLYDWLQVGH